jgi:hypothetical protein
MTGISCARPHILRTLGRPYPRGFFPFGLAQDGRE